MSKHERKMMNIARYLVVLGCLTLAGGGCGKEASAPTPGGMATQGGAPIVTETNSGVDLAELTRGLKRWIVSTRERPGSFEDYAAKAKVSVPPAPAGKKFAISKEMRVVLVDR